MKTKLVNPAYKPQLTSLLIGFLLGLCLLPTVVFADDEKAPSSGRSSGGRGCGTTNIPDQGVPALILLAPNQQPGQTTSTRPTFAWFVRDKDSIPLEFRLYEWEKNSFKVIKEIKGDRLKTTPGIMVLTLDNSTPELTPGKRYLWQVELVCHPSRPSANPFAQAEVEVVAMQPSLKTQLGEARDRVNQTHLLYQANLWYDALNQIFDPSTNTAQSKTLLSSMVKKITVNPTEQALLQNSPIHPVR
jgi:hypothetical protein